MYKVGRLESFIGDKIKSKITEDHWPPVVDESTIAEAKREAEAYLSQRRKVSRQKPNKK